MPNSKPPDQQKLTEGEIATLVRIARDRDHEDWHAARSKARWERAKSWALWIAAAGAAKGVIWPPLSELIEWLRAHWK